MSALTRLQLARNMHVQDVRDVPNVYGHVVAHLRTGDTVEVLDTIEEDMQTWVRIGYRQWCCLSWAGNVYLVAAPGP